MPRRLLLLACLCTFRTTLAAPSWTQVLATPPWTARQLAAVIGIPDGPMMGLWSIGGIRSGDTIDDRAWRSTDGGANWAVAAQTTSLKRAGACLWTFVNSTGTRLMVLAGGYTTGTLASPTGVSTTSYATSDGLSWGLTATSTAIQRWGASCTTFDNFMWMTSGRDSSGTDLTTSYMSRNGSYWELGGSVAANMAGVGGCSVVFQGTMLHLGGRSSGGTFRTATASKSSAGAAWGTSGPASYAARMFFGCVVYANTKLYVVGGQSTNTAWKNDLRSTTSLGSNFAADGNADWDTQSVALAQVTPYEFYTLGTIGEVPGTPGPLYQNDVYKFGTLSCASSPCTNGGTCFELSDNMICECPPGYSGYKCQTDINECSSAPCQNAGSCYTNNAVNGWVCECAPGFSGLRCQTDINECSSAPCTNGASCYTNTATNGWICECPPGYSGLTCQTDINECASAPCANGGSCYIQGVDGYVCECAPGYSGTTCLTDVNECASSPCVNGGSCYTNTAANAWVCECPPGYSGLRCQTDIDECASSPCANGGSCYTNQGGNSHVCECAPGFAGPVCESDVDECASSPCYNGGTCVNAFPAAYTCNCGVLYSGPRCATAEPTWLLVRSEPPPWTPRVLASTVGVPGTGVLRGLWSIGGYDPLTLAIHNAAWQSTDGGYTWINRTQHSALKRGAACLWLWESDGVQKLVIAGGFNETSGVNVVTNSGGANAITSVDSSVHSSLDGVTWTPVTSNGPVRWGAACTIFTGNMTMTNGRGTGSNSEVAGTSYSADGGLTWRLDTDNYAPAGIGACAIEFAGQLVLVGGQGGTNANTYSNTVRTKTALGDAGGWSAPAGGNTITAAKSFFACFVYNDRLHVAGGRTSLTAFNRDDRSTAAVTTAWTVTAANVFLSGGQTATFAQPSSYEVFVLGSQTTSANGITNNDVWKFSTQNCASSPCVNGGSCTEGLDVFLCYCPPGYSGLICQTDINECASGPCANGGSCYTAQGVNAYVCECAPGYSGSRCQTDVNECASAPCKNGGSCTTNQGVTSFVCTCLAGYSGLRCQTDVDECASSPCANAGSCYRNPGPPLGLPRFVLGASVTSTGSTTIAGSVASYPGLITGITVGMITGTREENTGLAGTTAATFAAALSWCNAQSSTQEMSGNINTPTTFLPGVYNWNAAMTVNSAVTFDAQGDSSAIFIMRVGGNPINILADVNLAGGARQDNIFWCCAGQVLVNTAVPVVYGSILATLAVQLGENVVMHGSIYSQSNQVSLSTNAVTTASVVAGTYSCSCPAGFSGTRCQTDIDECASAPCANGGLCYVNQGLNRFVCECAPGFSGIRCQTNIEQCGSAPCMNGGTCLDSFSVDGYACLCEASWTGPLCARPASTWLRPAGNTAPPWFSRSLAAVIGVPSGALAGLWHIGGITDAGTFIGDVYRSTNGGASWSLLVADDANLRRAGAYIWVWDDAGTPRIVVGSGFSSGSIASPASIKNDVYTSSDGITWTLDADSPDVARWGASVVQIGFGGAQRFAVMGGAIAGPTYRETVMATTGSGVDLANVNAAAELPEAAQGVGGCASLFAGKIFWIGGVNAGSYHSSVYYITTDVDNDSWTLVTPAYGFTPRAFFGCPQHEGLLYIVGGQTTGGAWSGNMDTISAFDVPSISQGPSAHLQQNIATATISPSVFYTFGEQNATAPVASSADVWRYSPLNCGSSPCFNGGTCAEAEDGYLCTCTAGHLGAQCQTDVNECASNPCANGGSCYTPTVNGFACTCPLGFSGTKCQTDVDECASSPCTNGGSCYTNQGVNGWVCQCAPGFSGSLCQTNIDDCASSPCTNGGTCVDTVNGYSCTCLPRYGDCGITSPGCSVDLHNSLHNCGTCGHMCHPPFHVNSTICMHGGCVNVTCEPGYTDCANDSVTCQTDTYNDKDNCDLCSHQCQAYNGGTRYCINSTCHATCAPGFSGLECEIDIDECASAPCANGATCSTNQAVNGYVCTCAAGYSGLTCTSDINECSSIPCLNSASCYTNNGPNGFVCECLPGWSGRLCQTQLDECASSPCRNGGTCNTNIACGPASRLNNMRYTGLLQNANTSSLPVGALGEGQMHRITRDGVFIAVMLSADKRFHLTNWGSIDIWDSITGTFVNTHNLQAWPRTGGAYCGFYTSSGRAWDFSPDGRRIVAQTLSTGVSDTRPDCGIMVWLLNNVTRFFELEQTGIFPGPAPTGLTTTVAVGITMCGNSERFFVARHQSMYEFGRVNSNWTWINPVIRAFNHIGAGSQLFAAASGSGFNPRVSYDCRTLAVPNQRDNTTGNIVPGSIMTWFRESINLPMTNAQRLPAPFAPAFTSGGSSFFFGSFMDMSDSGDVIAAAGNVVGVSTADMRALPQGFVVYRRDPNTNMTRWNLLQAPTVPGNTGNQYGVYFYCHNITQPAVFTSAIALSGDGRVIHAKAGRDGYPLTGGLGGTGADQALCTFEYTNELNTYIQYIPKRTHPTDLANSWANNLATTYDGRRIYGASDISLAVPSSQGIYIWAADCTDDQVGYVCTCPSGYSGSDCQTDIDECASSPCANAGSCYTNQAVNGFVCQCLSGFSGRLCQTDVDECASSPCTNGGSCVTGQGSNAYVCTCAPGFSGPVCQTDIDECASIPCQNGGSCYTAQEPNGYVCECAPGFSGITCSTDVDECASSPCANAGSCYTSQTINGFVCECVPGFSGTLCQTDADECASAPCANGGSCFTGQGINAYVCTCLAGYSGTQCQTDVNECASTPCQNGGVCYTNQAANGYVCTCATGYSGVLCESNANECASSPCVNGGSCYDGVNGFVCECPAPYSGNRCQTDIDECASAPCRNGGSCYTNQGTGGYVCTCAPGYSGAACGTDADECASAPCANGGSCFTNQGANGFICTCLPAYSGATCQTDIDECASSPCTNGGSCYTNQGVNAYVCECPAGFSGGNCQSSVDACSSAPCLNGASCYLELSGEATCECVAGFSGPLCQTNVNECISSPCMNGGSCVDLNGAYTCTCPAGYTGGLCQTDVDECASNPCANGGSCYTSQAVNAYVCECPSGYSGARCQTNINDCASTPCRNGGTCFEDTYRYACFVSMCSIV